MSLQSLGDKIWITRKCRINLSERLKKNNLLSQSLIIWYSFLLIALTIFDKNSSYFKDSYSLTLILSIGILVLSIFIMSMNYSERAIKAQILYVQLDCLCNQVENAVQCDEKKLYEQYTNLIALTENHSDYDYLKTQYDLKDMDKIKYPNPPVLKIVDYINFYFQKFFSIFGWIFSAVLPLLIFLWTKA